MELRGPGADAWYSRSSSARQANDFERMYFGHTVKKTALAQTLLDLWSWGHIPATMVQRIAMAAAQDLQEGFQQHLREWTILADLGTQGLHVNHISRDLVRKFPSPVFSAAWKIFIKLCVYFRPEILMTLYILSESA